ncbi:MAG: KpsF/GutQ family sugar-phosphate isomerase [Thermodesulfobacteriota bacterium]
MASPRCQQAVEVLKTEAEGILALVEQVGPAFDRAVEAMLATSGRVVITGIGKSGIIGQKIAATLNSTGTPSFFLHPVEAMHGDLGMVGATDVVLAISYSGETAELTRLLDPLKRRGTTIIALTGRVDSTLGRQADIVLSAAVPREACPLGLAPTASTTAALALGDALAVVLINEKRFEARDFRRNHPGGSLGERLKVGVAEVMLTGPAIPRVGPEVSLGEAAAELNRKNLGAVLVTGQRDSVLGILTDGDLRRLLLGQPAGGLDLGQTRVAEVMTRSPKTIQQDLLAADAVSLMQRHEITILAVVDGLDRLAGILHLQDLLGKGEFRFLV